VVVFGGFFFVCWGFFFVLFFFFFFFFCGGLVLGFSGLFWGCCGLCRQLALSCWAGALVLLSFFLASHFFSPSADGSDPRRPYDNPTALRPSLKRLTFFRAMPRPFDPPVCVVPICRPYLAPYRAQAHFYSQLVDFLRWRQRISQIVFIPSARSQPPPQIIPAASPAAVPPSPHSPTKTFS